MVVIGFMVGWNGVFFFVEKIKVAVGCIKERTYRAPDGGSSDT